MSLLRFGKDSLIYGIGSTLSRLLSVFALPLFTGYLSPLDFGVLALLSLMAMVIQPVFSLGLGAAIGPSYLKSSCESTRAKVVWTSFFLTLSVSFPLVVFAFVFPSRFYSLVDLSSHYYAVAGLYLMATIFLVLSTTFMQVLQLEGKSLHYVLITTTSSVASFAVSVPAVCFFGLGISGVVYGIFIGNALVLFLALVWYLLRSPPIFCKLVAKELLLLGLPLVPSFAALFLLMNGNRYVLQSIEGLNKLGIYSVGFSLGSTITIFTSGVTSAWYPFFMSYIDKKKEAVEVFQKAFHYYVIVGALVTSLYFLMARPLFSLFIANKFHAAYSVVGLIALAYSIQVFFNFYLPGIYFDRKVEIVSLIQLISALFAIAISFLLINSFSFMGAALGVLSGNIVLCLLIRLYAERTSTFVIKYDLSPHARIIILLAAVVALADYIQFFDMVLEALKYVLAVSSCLFICVSGLNPVDFARIRMLIKSTRVSGS